MQVFDAYEIERAETEAWVADLPGDVKSRIISNLRSQKFLDYYHELAVYHVLRRLGYAPEYEKKIDGKKPDWYVPTKGDIPAFIVELFTANPSRETAADMRQQADLIGRLQQITIGVRLGISIHPNSQVVLDETTNKMVVEEVKRWLMEENPAIGSQLNLPGIVIEMWHRDASYSHVLPTGFPEVLYANPGQLRGTFEKKIKKYEELALQNRIPLVVAVIAKTMTGVGLDNFWDILFGQETFEITFGDSPREIIDQRQFRKPDGILRTASPALSVALWVWKDYGEWHVKAIHNPNALCPLPPNAFGNPDAK